MSVAYEQRRGELATYFDRTAVDAWQRLTSDAPVGRIRATVRAGRDRMRAMLLGWMPDDLRGARVLDAGCGTGALAVELARRGADVTGVDLSPTLLGLAAERLPAGLPGRVTFVAGDMLSAADGDFDHAVAMDSLIHYPEDAMVDAIGRLLSRVRHSAVVTFAPKTTMLSAMHGIGRVFPRGDRAPAIEPIGERTLVRRLDALEGWRVGRTERVSGGFYTSQGLELLR
jgi:magnesium-protoporphyrin O-methyltransferase